LEKQKGQWKTVGQLSVRKQPEPDNMASLESRFRSLGNRLLGMDKTEEAIKVFKLNAEFFPESNWVYESLGEAYMAAGNTKLAIQNLTKSLQLNPKNANSKKMLDKLEKK
jgi:tetratricopeptide (TPR) repeat protein